MKSGNRKILDLFVILAITAGVIVFLNLQKPAKIENKSSEVVKKQKETHQKQKALTIYDKEKSYEGFTIYPTSGTAEVQLLNMSGKIVHNWALDADRARLLPNCNLLVIHGSKWGLEHEPWASLRSTVREYDWEGKTVWEHKFAEPVHHDIKRLENGNTLTVYLTEVPGILKQKIRDPKVRGAPIRSDVVVEISPAGKTVWSWAAHEHLDLNSCGPRTCDELRSRKIDGKRRLDWTHINSVGVLPENKHYDQGDTRFKPGNVIIHARNWWTTMIIDRETKEVVWRYRGDYKGGISGGHDPYMVPKGLPGAGNIIIFDNGRAAKESKILEINPQTKKLNWVYDVGSKFNSVVAGSTQRFPNGNTLVSEDARGRVFEVTPQNERVWEYKGVKMRINRAYRYSQNYCEKLENLPLSQ